MERYIDVSLNVPVDKPFTYKVRDDEMDKAKAGSRVEVSLSGRRMTGVITAVYDTLVNCKVDAAKIKSARRIIDNAPIITEELMTLARWMADYYLCAYGEVLNAMIPSGRREISPAAQSITDEWGGRCCLSNEQNAAVDGICSFLQTPAMQKLVHEGGSAQVHEGDRAQEHGCYNAQWSEGGRAQAHGCYNAQGRGGDSTQVHKGNTALGGGGDNALGGGGNEAADGGNSKRDKENKTLGGGNNGERDNIYHYLYGPTGSGKTEVFLTAAERVKERGMGVIYLVPEIALTPQVERAVRERFLDSVAVLHSALTGSERLFQWQRIMRSEARVVVGARSAVFAPMPNLGLIIIDEEHDASYKSSNTPRYHARQVAMRRCKMLNIPLVMGSATPSVESWQAIKSGTFSCHTLHNRLAGGAMPSIECVDLTREGMESACFSRRLVEEVRSTLAKKRQAILFLNRRGFTHFFRCMECGFELMCPNCSVPMTYHKAENSLRCHYCGHVERPLQLCPKCGSLNIGYSGFGTEAVEAEARSLFPNARIERADADILSSRAESTVSSKENKAVKGRGGNRLKARALEDTLTRFRNGECDILLGTQMVAKGLNFPGLSLVGVMLADTALHFPDFRAAERTFSLITQVAGRAGRYFPDGRVIVQTYNPNTSAIRYAVNSDTEGFYERELKDREMTSFPPFSRMINIVFRSANETAAKNTSEEAAGILQKLSGKQIDALTGKRQFAVLGPAQCPIYKIAKNYRRRLLLRGKQIAPIAQAVRTMLHLIHKNYDVYIEVDIDPVSML